MACSSLQQAVGERPAPVSVNGVAIPRDAIAREAQHHPAPKPIAAWQAAARALVIRELLLQEAGRLGIAPEPAADAQGRRETDDEAMMRALVEREVKVPVADLESCRRYYDNNRARFRASNGTVQAFALVSAHIAHYLHARASRTALAQYVARLLAVADISGIAMDAERHRVN